MENVVTMDNLIICVQSIIKAEENHTLETITPCKYTKKNDVEFLTYYDENYVEGEKVLTMLKICGDKIEIIRQKPYDQHFVIGDKITHKTDYKTQYGNLKLDLVTTFWERDFNEGIGTITSHYEVHINGQKQSENQLKITVKIDK